MHSVEITPKTATVFDIFFVLFTVMQIGFQEIPCLAGSL
jgi:hypothetical protein